MPRALFACCAIVAAFQLHPAAASPVEDLPLPPVVAAFAARYEVDAARDRARFLTDLIKRLYPNVEARPADIALLAAPGPQPPSAIRIPVPLSLQTWSRAIFKRTIPPDQLLPSILRDVRAAYLCRGLAAMDSETLDFVTAHPALLAFLYERHSAVVAGFGDMLRVHNGRLVLPGGDEAVPLWQSVLLAPLDDPERAARALFTEREGRMAYLAALIDSAEPAVARFALGLWIQDPALRERRFLAAAGNVAAGYGEWHALERPFARPLGDLGQLLLRIKVDENGAPVNPSARTFWSEALDVSPGLPVPDEALEPRIDLAWLVEATAHQDMYSRSERLDQFAFGQRVFAGVPSESEIAAAEIVRAYPRRRMLLLTLERLSLSDPALYRSALQRADSLDSSSSSRRFWTYAQFQGAMAMIVRMSRVGSLSQSQTVSLLNSLIAVPLENDGYEGAIAAWFHDHLAAALPAGSSWEDRVLTAISGPMDAADMPRVDWEGQSYRYDTALAERQRLEIVRRKQAGHTIDLALTVAGIADSISSDGVTLDVVRDSAREMRAILTTNASRLRHPAVNLMPPSVELPRDSQSWLTEAASELEKITRVTDLRRTARVAASLRHLTDVMLGNALVSVIYASEIGDPEGAALLAGNVSLRHDFGLGKRDGDTRARQAWAMPRQDFQPGIPWHVTGALLSLDVALAPLQLRRDAERLLSAPKLSSIEREGIAVGVVLMDRRRLTDEARDHLAVAIERGRRRVESLTEGGDEDLSAIEEYLGMDGWRRRALEWSIREDPLSVPLRFSLVDMLWLGTGQDDVDVDAWGMSGLYSHGCVCTRMPTPRSWRLFEGRYQLPTVAATMGDLNLAVALALHGLRLPAGVERIVLSVSMHDFMDDLIPAGSGEWWGLVNEARGISTERIQDYVSIAAAVDGPLIPEDLDSIPQD